MDKSYKLKYYKYKRKYLQLKGGQTRNKIIGISGISGAGKSTVAKLLAKRFEGIYVDQDWFYRKQKPLIKLSNDKTKPNWDHIDAIDIKRMNSFLRDKKKLDKPIFLAGFALRDDIFHPDTKLDYHIHLRIPKELSLQTRLKVKGFKDRDVETQRLMFEEAVYPFYLESLEKSTINHTFDVMDPPDSYDLKDRIPLDKEIDQIVELLKVEISKILS
jgi:thymidylate kinase